MIQEKDLDSWEQLLEELEVLSQSCGEKADKILYRGQPNSVWRLDTTLERNLKSPINLSRYYRFAHTAKTRIETFTGHDWDILTPPDYNSWLKKKDALSFSPFPAYDYLAYLRHHGFPSPLLDWTASPYIAIFFAFKGTAHDAKSVSLYCFLEYADVGKIRSSNQPEIHTFGPYVKVHRRHVLQQSQYSICVEFDKDHNSIYANHEEVFKRNEERQDKLWKFNIPAIERVKALKALDKMNINLFSLFGSEDSLIETISTNEIIKNNL